MKKLFNSLLLFLAAFVLLQCSTETEVVPQTEDDQATHANAYADQFLTIEGVAVKDDPEDTRPGTIILTISGNGGRVSVNYGDGTIEKMDVVDGGVQISHVYEREGNFRITVSGDIKTITEFRTDWPNFKLTNVHFGGLTNLQSVDIYGLATSPARINLSQNRQLYSINLTELGTTTDIILPATNRIRFFSVAGTKNLSTAVIDRIIARIYDSVKASPRSGSITLTKEDYAYDSEPREFIAPPSSWSMNKLRTLRYTFNWFVDPGV